MTSEIAAAAVAQALSRISGDAILNALEMAVIVVGPESRIEYANSAGEQLLGASVQQFHTRPLQDFIPRDNPIFALIDQVRARETSVTEYGLTLDSPRLQKHFVNVQGSFDPELPDHVVLSFFERSITEQIDRQLTHRSAVRSVTAMAAMLAHEVKNPLSGIRGAAQLLEQNSQAEDQKLTRLICDETDRICALVDRMEVFSDSRPLQRRAVNIHEVLGYVRQLATAGFGRDVKIVERYDPSLPPVYGHRDQLVQVLLNLVKNASEAVPERNGEIQLSTAYRHSVRFAVPGSSERTHLPLVISVEDNGAGIPPEIQDQLFEPFVSAKPRGTGLGLALVAKMIGDHGGVVEFESEPGKTIFRLMLPVAPANGEVNP